MTAKRFKLLYSQLGTGMIVDTLKKEDLIVDKEFQKVGLIKVVELLNALHEENEQLKSKNRGLQSELQIFKEDVTHSNLQINKLADENEQLKLDLKVERDGGNLYKDLCEALEKENEQLKKELKGYYDAFDCSQCMHHNYDWFDDCDEFEVCDKGNDDTQMNNHSCKDWEEL